ncbi:MAG: TetR/AcrR family transcriptional regulator [Myxococcales bacterium]|nr:TetR/AcrR family transcriptional regulator [Myxococcales bacterium]MCB9569915.1 TetR/AcrR family transcriptional regulator [Myxococcales bacterium]MCB9704068.1 TetR/AcrR family transcriptional regulator [Myxococcales bacterium]
MATTTRRKGKTRSVREAVREETRAAYREAILSAASEVFGRLGFHDAKMADIAAEAGVAAGTLYNYFSSKEEVFASILERGQEQLFGALAEVVARGGDPLDRLQEVLRTLYGFLERSGPFFAVYLRQGGLAEWTRQRLRESEDRTFHRNLALMEGLLREACEAGLLRGDRDPDELGAVLAGISDAQIFAWVRRGCPPDLTARSAVVFDLFLHGASRR